MLIVKNAHLSQSTPPTGCLLPHRHVKTMVPHLLADSGE